MLKIGVDFALGANSLNIILYEKHIGKKGKSEGKEIWQESAYFSTPHNALDYLVEHQIKKTELKDLKTICLMIDEIKGWIKELEIPRDAL